MYTGLVAPDVAVNVVELPLQIVVVPVKSLIVGQLVIETITLPVIEIAQLEVALVAITV